MKVYARKKSDTNYKPFPMPKSLTYLKVLGAAGIDWQGLHIIDLTSLVYSIWIDSLIQRLENERQSKMSKRGIAEYRQATEADFNAL